jgi:broad specificity phosphatase PhoE
MKITLIRHGESIANVGHYISDDPRKPVCLTPKGRAQAEALAQQLRHESFTHAYVSEFPRAQETAGILLQHHALLPVVDARLNERKSGMDGQPVHLFNDQVLRDPLNFSTPWGESFLQQMERLRSLLDELHLRHPEGRIIAVSHENPIIAALALTVADPAQVVLQGLPNCGRLDLHWPHAS